MMGIRLNFGMAVGLGALVLAGPAGAQDSLDQGKTPAQLYASDCAICHKSPQGLAKAGGMFGVQNFLREHYTASKEAAAAIAAYLESVDRGAAARSGPSKRGDKGEGSGKPRVKKNDAKPGEAKTLNSKASGDKAPDGKPSETKPSETKPAETKPAETKPDETKASEPSPAEAKPSEPKVVEPKADPKPAEAAPPEKQD